MQIDSPTVRRLRDMLLERAGLLSEIGAEIGAEGGRVVLEESSPEVQALMGRIAPMCEVLYLMMVADGESDASELESIRGAIVTLSADGLSSEAVDTMLAGYASAAAAHGRDERLMHVAARLSGDREDAEAALALAAAVAMADGSVATAEESVLVELSELLGISRQRAAIILDTSG